MSESVQPSVGRHDVIGGAVLAVLSVAALGLTFYHQPPGGFFGPILWIRALCLALALMNGAVALGLLPVRSPQDYYGGLALVGLALVAFWAGKELPGMRGFAFGPGTAPRLFAGILAALGVAITLTGVLMSGPRIERYAWRGPLFITAAILLFANTIRPLGLVVASFLVIMTSAFAAPDVRWKETVIWAVILTAFCSFLFPYALNLPFQLWPRF
jgi:putative tricarboxylic transport membrane protein